MSEKVLGFYEKEASLENPGIWIIRMEKLVSVRLASESVDLKALKEKLKERERKIWEGTQTLLAHEIDIEKIELMKKVANWELNNIYSWAEKEAKKK